LPASSRLIKLLTTLHQRTGKGIQKWTTGSRDDTFIWSGSSASVSMLTRDNDGETPFVVRLIDSEGRIVEEEIFEFTDESIELVRELYAQARSDALDIDAAIQSLLDDLEGF
jgi:hypothetical protein